MNDIFRWLARIHSPAISKDQALEIARRECEKRGIAWREPVHVIWEFGNWAVWTHAGHRGGNVRIIIDKMSGEIRNVSGPIKR